MVAGVVQRQWARAGTSHFDEDERNKRGFGEGTTQRPDTLPGEPARVTVGTIPQIPAFDVEGAIDDVLSPFSKNMQYL